MMANVAGAIYEGTIILWSGAVVDIPTDWYLCDGNNGTPDLTDNFIVGAGNTYNPDDTGGALSHTHTGTIAAHGHGLQLGSAKRTIKAGSPFISSTETDGDTFTTVAAANLPLYYALAFIYNPTIPQGAYPGSIVLWSGAIGDIPIGWSLCDGTGATPDLRNKFVIGAGDTYAVDASGGTSTHTHTGTSNGHNHTILGGGESVDSGTAVDSVTNTTQLTFTTNSSSTFPPYYALAYIQNTSAGTQGIYTGMIVYWSGAIVDIPTGFVLCDGNNSTPDLRDRFVVGAGDTYGVGDAGSAHSHSGTSDSHNHTVADGNDIAATGVFIRTLEGKTPSLSTVANTTLPPYYSLAYMMKT